MGKLTWFLHEHERWGFNELLNNYHNLTIKRCAMRKQMQNEDEKKSGLLDNILIFLEIFYEQKTLHQYLYDLRVIEMH